MVKWELDVKSESAAKSVTRVLCGRNAVTAVSENPDCTHTLLGMYYPLPTAREP
jgi:hypothetical protein